MLKMKIAAAILVAVFAFAPMQAHAVLPAAASSTVAPVVPGLIFACAGGIIFAAAIAPAQHKQQLTQLDALTCGWLFLLNSHQRRKR